LNVTVSIARHSHLARQWHRVDEARVLRCKAALAGAGGFTLMELLVTLAVGAIALSISVPSMSGLIRNTRATTYTNDLVAAINIARSEAVQRGRPVTVCSSTDGATCSDDEDWSAGWIVLAPNAELIRSWPALDGGADVLVADVDRVQFLARGWASAVSSDFSLRLPDCQGFQGRDVNVNNAGRVSVTRVGC
jgi:type IV fimbrial biogenesis protein FimT